MESAPECVVGSHYCPTRRCVESIRPENTKTEGRGRPSHWTLAASPGRGVS
jgi:hypothetical protein